MTFKRPANHFFSLLVLTLYMVLAGCSSESAVAVVDFSNTVIVDRHEPDSPDGALHVAVAAMVSPKETAIHYRALLDFVSAKLGRDIRLVQRKTYSEVNELIGSGEIDLAFICSGPYVTGKPKFGFEALAVPVVRQKPVYRSYLIANTNSAFQTLADLKGKLFAFSDPESNTGYLVPTYMLSARGERPESFFAKTIFTYGHDNSILAVARSLVDAASVHEHIWEYHQQHRFEDALRTRVILKSEPFGNPPLIASPHLDPVLKQRIGHLLLTMNADTNGKNILARLMIDRFIPLQEKWYDPIRKMLAHLDKESIPPRGELLQPQAEK